MMELVYIVGFLTYILGVQVPLSAMMFLTYNSNVPDYLILNYTTIVEHIPQNFRNNFPNNIPPDWPPFLNFPVDGPPRDWRLLLEEILNEDEDIPKSYYLEITFLLSLGVLGITWFLAWKLTGSLEKSLQDDLAALKKDIELWKMFKEDIEKNQLLDLLADFSKNNSDFQHLKFLHENYDGETFLKIITAWNENLNIYNFFKNLKADLEKDQFLEFLTTLKGNSEKEKIFKFLSEDFIKKDFFEFQHRNDFYEIFKNLKKIAQNPYIDPYPDEFVYTYLLYFFNEFL